MLPDKNDPTEKEIEYLKRYYLVPMGKPFYSWVFQNLKTGKLYDLSSADLKQISYIIEADKFLIGKDSLYFGD